MVFSDAINYPSSFDSNENLYQVHDGLRVVLAEDYSPGDTSITVFANSETMDLFGDTGIITLTDQCNEIESRGLSFYYGSHTETTFDQLELLPGHVDASKPKNLTNVVQNVMAIHHNSLKNSIIAIQQFVGKKNEEAIKPLQGTMQQRIKYLNSVAFAPKAWFTIDKRLGVVPFIVNFKSLGINLGIEDQITNTLEQVWDFGDGLQLIVNQRWNSDLTTQKVTFLLKGQTDTSDLVKVRQDVTWTPEVDLVLPTQNLTLEIENFRTGFDATINVNVNLEKNGTLVVTKEYVLPIICDVSLEIINDFGRDSISFPKIVSCKFMAPQDAVIEITDMSQTTNKEILSNPYGNAYLRLKSNKVIDITTTDDGSHPDDPVISYTWSIFDDLTHGNSASTKAIFSVGGLYDIILRVDTNLQNYKITSYENAIDVVEKYNLWLWNYKLSGSSTDYGEVEPMEFGLLSETFKVYSSAPGSIVLAASDEGIDDSFLDPIDPDDPVLVANSLIKKKKFKRNAGFAANTTSPSGDANDAIVYYADEENHVNFYKFNGFNQTSTLFATGVNTNSINWDFISFNSYNYLYLLNIDFDTNQIFKFKVNLQNGAFHEDSGLEILPADLKNGSGDIATSDADDPGTINYRSTWRADTGYILNSVPGKYNRFTNFYKTTRISSDEFIGLTKLIELPGIKEEGQLVPLSQGVYFFNNSGGILLYNPTSNTWTAGGTSANSALYRSLQDVTVPNFDDLKNTLLAASDGENLAFLSFDYSDKSFIRFNEYDLTFTLMAIRPRKDQWNMGIY